MEGEDLRRRICVSVPIDIREAIEGIARYDARTPASLIQKVLKRAIKKSRAPSKKAKKAKK